MIYLVSLLVHFIFLNDLDENPLQIMKECRCGNIETNCTGSDSVDGSRRVHVCDITCSIFDTIESRIDGSFVSFSVHSLQFQLYDVIITS